MDVEDLQCHSENLGPSQDPIEFETASAFSDSMLGILSHFMANSLLGITCGSSSSSQDGFRCFGVHKGFFNQFQSMILVFLSVLSILLFYML